MSERQTLALLPGLLLDGDLWREQCEALEDLAECRIADLTRHDSMADMARFALEGLPPRFALAGLSMGGYVALEIMRQAPERVERLALIATNARTDTPDVRLRRLDLMALAERGRFQGVTPRLLPLFLHEDRVADTALMERIAAQARRVGRDGFLRQQQAILTRPDSRPTLVRITCPTLVLCGRQDRLVPVELHQELAAGIARSRLAVIENCGHLPPLEAPQQTAGHLRRWLLEPA